MTKARERDGLPRSGRGWRAGSRGPANRTGVSRWHDGTLGTPRRRGHSVRFKLTMSYAGLVVVVGTLLLVVVWVIILGFLPDVGVSPVGMLVRADLLRSIAASWVILMAFLLAVGLGGGWLLAGWMLRPLARITEATRLAATGSLTHRIQLDGRMDEFRELADAFDTMLARLEAHVASQQRFAANASHELRTPLALTRTLLDVARADPHHDSSELVDRLGEVNTRAIDLTEALLLLGQADGRSFARERVDVSLAAEEAAERLLPLAEAHGVGVETSSEIAHVVGSPTLLAQMVTNLLHNAIVHNLPGDGAVWVTTRAVSGGVVLTVENTGEALSPESMPVLAEPFHRGAGRARDGHAGAGLGLAIVKSIVRAHGGTLALAPRMGGGLRVIVRLPAS